MCGVVGFYTNQLSGDQLDVLENIFRESQIRGLHSFGYSFLKGKTIVTRKEHCITDMVEQLWEDKPTALIGHNRYATSGDWKDHNNNQPITIGDQSVVFNGVISQATKEENEKQYNLRLTYDNDAEIFLRQRDKKKFVEFLRGSFAGLYIEKGEIFFIRNSRRPAWCGICHGAVYVGSTEDILRKAGIQSPFELKTNIPIKLSTLA